MFFISCKSTKENIIIGGDQDSYGCKGSAGYQWSELKNECIRSFELPLQLFNQERTYGAGVYFLPDSSKSEVFCKEGRFVLNKINDTTYEDIRIEYDLSIKDQKFIFLDKHHLFVYSN